MGRVGVVEVRGSGQGGREGVGALCKDELMAEVNPGRYRKKMSGWKGDTLRRDALKRGECGVRASECMQLEPGAVENGVGVVPR